MPQATTKAQLPPPPAQAPVAQTPTAIISSRPGAPAIPIPLTQADVSNLQDRVSELAGERNAADSRRATLARQLHAARPGADQAGIEARITQLDNRILLIESDIADLGRAISAAPNGLKQVSTSAGIPHEYGRPDAKQMTGITIVGIIFVLFPLSIAFARLMFRRAAHPPAPQIPKDVSDRLERMEQGIEAVALEVERIGEGQRFVTQLMGDRAQRAALPEGVRRTP